MAKRHLRFKRRFRFNNRQSVIDAVNVCVDADGGFLKSERNDKVGGFASHTGQLNEFLNRLGNLPAK
ncbi:MAG: hypothetical protein Q4F99_03330 [bacterium]|nr:hypothetical protein [bacterium]